MSTEKFNNSDRQVVIRELGNILKIGLSPIGRYRKFCEGTDGNAYCVLGGYGDWHGIPGPVIEQPLSYGKEIFLVVAKVYNSKIDIFCGSMTPLIENKHRLTLNGDGVYQFDIRNISGDKLLIKQLQDFFLSKLGSIPLT